MTRHVSVIGLGFGDEGKGTTVDYLASTGEFSYVIKSSGGAQCAHHVVREDDAVHRFAQFGSGTFWGLPTHLSKFFMVEPMRLAAEADALSALGVVNPYSLLTVDERCLITTPLHTALNRMKERLRDQPHGSCGIGIGETMRCSLINPFLVLRAGDLRDPKMVQDKLNFMRSKFGRDLSIHSDDDGLPSDAELIEVYSAFADTVNVVPPDYMASMLDGWMIFEGSQGVLLDEWHGFHPNTTWATTTFDNAHLLLKEAGHKSPREILGLGCLRAYTTRHGYGPFPTEDESMLKTHPEEHNGTGRFQGAWRAGHFDAVLHRYAWQAVKDTFFWHKLAITHLDRPAENICTGYTVDGMSVSGLVPLPGQRRTLESDDLAYQHKIGETLYRAQPVYRDMDYYYGGPVKNIEGTLNADCVLESYGPKASDKKSML